ncbi:MAG: hypothetical protein Q9213_001613 [Squamulea squamosa]
MRFNLSFQTHRCSEWVLHYVDYQAIRELLKARRYDDANNALIEDLVKVEGFYLLQFRQLHQQSVDLLVTDATRPQTSDKTIYRHVAALRRLQWFGYMNYIAFRRLLNKLGTDKNKGYRRQQLLDDQNFVRQTECLALLETLEALQDGLNHSRSSDMLLEPVEAEVMDEQTSASRWTTKENAGLRGYWGLMKSLANEPLESKPSIEDNLALNPTEHIHFPGPSWLSRRLRGPDQDESYILVSLGASNTREYKPTIDLTTSPKRNYDKVQQQTGFALEVDVIGGSGPCQPVLLPMLEDLTNRPVRFRCHDPEQTQLVFRLYKIKDYREPRAHHIGSGIAILSTLRARLGPRHESLVRDHTIPILAKDTLNALGFVTFSFLVITPLPLPHPSIASVATHGFWKGNGETAIIGHRGSGANTTKQSNLQIGENTVQSFLSAAASGATCVEFDVQLTKDLVPVIFHDFLVMETGGDVPLHTLTRDQFMHLNKLQTSLGGWEVDGHSSKPKPRSRSETRPNLDEIRDLRRRMRYTEEGIRYEIKGNLRGCSIQEASTTLEELLTRIPTSIAFNLEMKLNLFVDTILKMVWRLAGQRSITFSSFSPEICVFLAIKQQQYPILFISKGGSVPTGDARASSLQQAVHFAKAWDLAGIVMLSDVFVHCPRLLRYAKSKGLVCGSYGDLNDDPECAKIQAEAGLDAMMVNKVRLICRALDKPVTNATPLI